MAICEIHNESTSLYCNQCNVIVCEDCLKSKQHYMHDTSGNISEILNKNRKTIEDQCDLIDVRSYDIRETLIKLNGDIDQDDLHPANKRKILLNDLYVEKAMDKLDKLYKSRGDLERLNDPDGIENNGYYKALQEKMIISTNLLSMTESFANLNSFTEKINNEYEPISSTERPILFLTNDQSYENLNHMIYINEDVYLISFINQENLNQFDVKFTWTNPSKIWSYDLRIKILIKLAPEAYKELSDSNTLITPTENSKILCNINPSKLINSLMSSENDSNEENKEYKNSESPKKVPTTTTSETIKLKINIAKVDYGYQEKMSIMLQESLISKIHQRINDL